MFCNTGPEGAMGMKPRWEILADIINREKYTHIVEVGVSRGINACNLLKLCPNVQKMYLVDITDSVFDFGMFKEAGIHNKIQFLPMASEDAVKHINRDFELVFIDANHAYDSVKKDIALWWPKVHPGGILCGHDYINGQPNYGVVQAVDEWSNTIDYKVNFEDDVLEEGKLKIWWVKKEWRFGNESK